MARALCSRDIQAGDHFQQESVLFPAYISTCIEVRDDFVKCDEERLWASHTVFKIIGEISPEAKWVKEGDEFVEDEIFLSKYGSNWDNKKPLSQKYTAFIKGSCGHFH